MSSNGTSAPPETSSASCQAASSTKLARVSCSARLCMPAGSSRACRVLPRAAYVAGRTELLGEVGHRPAGALRAALRLLPLLLAPQRRQVEGVVGAADGLAAARVV